MKIISTLLIISCFGTISLANTANIRVYDSYTEKTVSLDEYLLATGGTLVENEEITTANNNPPRYQGVDGKGNGFTGLPLVPLIPDRGYPSSKPPKNEDVYKPKRR